MSKDSRGGETKAGGTEERQESQGAEEAEAGGTGKRQESQGAREAEDAGGGGGT